MALFTDASRLLARLRRTPILLAHILLLTVSLASAPAAHEGHDHGDVAVSPMTASPRLALQSDIYQLVGTAAGGRLTIYLDSFATNEPIDGAAIEVMLPEETLLASGIGDGLYRVDSKAIEGSGPLELVFAISAPMGDDLLVGSLVLPSAAAVLSASPAKGGISERAKAFLNSLGRSLGSAGSGSMMAIAGASAFGGLILGIALRRPRRLRPVPVAVAVFAFSLLLIGGASAHEGHVHGNEEVTVMVGDAPRRLADGSVFLPKPSQRLLAVRTRLMANEQAEKAATLMGRVVADPNRSGLVQSINGGRLLPPEDGFPVLGRSVKRGDLLALLEQPLGRADRTGLSERLGDLEQQIALAEARLDRVRELVQRAAAPANQVSDAITELEGLKARREILLASRVEQEELRAPIDGVIAGANAVAGQVVQAQDVLFQIVDPVGLWVEALVFGEVDPAQISGASGVTSSGIRFDLSFIGFSRTLQQQATRVQFAIQEAVENIKIGQPVTVIARNGASEGGIILPREALVRGGNGQAMVWLHRDPEVFEARSVRVEPYDANRVAVLAGVSAGERVVVQGAELINQVR